MASRRKGGAHTAAAHSPTGRSFALLLTIDTPTVSASRPSRATPWLSALPERAQGLVDGALPFQVHRVPHVGNDVQFRAGNQARDLLARREGRELIEGAVHHQGGNAKLRKT